MKINVFKWFSITSIGLWLSLFGLAPLLFVFLISFLKPSATELFLWQLSFENFVTLINPIYVHIAWRSLYLAALVALLCLAFGYPFAFILSRLAKWQQKICLLLVIIPFWTSSLIRTYAVIAIIKTKGILNGVLLYFGIIDQPLQILYTQIAVIIGLVYTLLPFMILPLFTNLEKIDSRLIEAAYDLGANRWQTFYRVIFPLSLPGIMSGTLLVFLPAMTIFYIPDILGGAKSLLLGNLIAIQYLSSHNWPLGSAISIALTFILLLMLTLYWHLQQRNRRRGP